MCLGQGLKFFKRHPTVGVEVHDYETFAPLRFELGNGNAVVAAVVVPAEMLEPCAAGGDLGAIQIPILVNVTPGEAFPARAVQLNQSYGAASIHVEQSKPGGSW